MTAETDTPTGKTLVVANSQSGEVASGSFVITESSLALLCLSQDIVGFSQKVGRSPGVSILFSFLPLFGIYVVTTNLFRFIR